MRTVSEFSNPEELLAAAESPNNTARHIRALNQLARQAGGQPIVPEHPSDGINQGLILLGSVPNSRFLS